MFAKFSMQSIHRCCKIYDTVDQNTSQIISDEVIEMDPGLGGDYVFCVKLKLRFVLLLFSIINKCLLYLSFSQKNFLSTKTF